MKQWPDRIIHLFQLRRIFPVRTIRSMILKLQDIIIPKYTSGNGPQKLPLRTWFDKTIKKPLAYVVANRWHMSLWFKMKLFFCWLRCKKKNLRKSIIESGGQAVESWSIWGQKFVFSQIDWNFIKTILNSQKAFQNDFYGVSRQ